MMLRIRCPWTGFPGGPGLSTFYVDPTVTDVTPIKTFLGAVTTWIPNTVKIDIPAIGDVINPIDGKITNAQSVSGSGQVGGSVTPASYSASSGAQVRWDTQGIINGHRVAGATFLVPLGGVAYSNTGAISSGVASSIQTAINALLVAPATLNRLLVWARPFPGRDATTIPPRPARPARDGSQHVITAGSVVGKAVVLRSRRD